mmetsp:Transcript_25054/g.39350  ORF Transcript_25054/g.39350 Transcript_25054/m.39350 type:complete len:93 (+) Transcript_25054:452-730(+)
MRCPFFAAKCNAVFPLSSGAETSNSLQFLSNTCRLSPEQHRLQDLRAKPHNLDPNPQTRGRTKGSPKASLYQTSVHRNGVWGLGFEVWGLGV